MRCPICNDCISQWEPHKCEEVMVDNQELTSEGLEGREGKGLSDRIEKILELDKKRTNASFTHQKAGVYPNGDNEHDAIYIKPYHKRFSTFYGNGIKRIIIQEVSYEQETERGSVYLLRDVIRSADAKFLSSAPEMVSIIKELTKQLTATRQALDEAQANIAAQEISYKEWVVKHSEMYAENKKLQQALDRAVEALQKIVFDSTDIHACYHNNRRCLGCDKEDAEHGNTCIVMTAKAALASIKEGL